jgi:hypothetical protein
MISSDGPPAAEVNVRRSLTPAAPILPNRRKFGNSLRSIVFTG